MFPDVSPGSEPQIQRGSLCWHGWVPAPPKMGRATTGLVNIHTQLLDSKSFWYGILMFGLIMLAIVCLLFFCCFPFVQLVFQDQGVDIHEHYWAFQYCTTGWQKHLRRTHLQPLGSKERRRKWFNQGCKAQWQGCKTVVQGGTVLCSSQLPWCVGNWVRTEKKQLTNCFELGLLHAHCSFKKTFLFLFIDQDILYQ